jgi:endoglucanase
VYGARIPSSTSWRTEDGIVYHKDKPVKLKGVNWFGFETDQLLVHGLWTGRTMDSFLAQIVEMGFTSLRVPVAPEVFSQQKAIANLHTFATAAEGHGLSILLDLHNCSPRENLKGNPGGCANYSIDKWYATLGSMTLFSLHHENVLGIDIFNEPHQLSWKTWRDLATEAGKQILTLNPRILVFVEGVAQRDTDSGGYGAFWGENLVEASRNPPGIPKSRLVLSPHVYGPSVSYQQYFSAGNFPNNMPQIWEAHWGYLVGMGYTVIVGEFGGRYTGKDKQWADKFVEYLRSKGNTDFYYWSLNPNSGDTGGILRDDWKSVNQEKLDLLKRIF